ncbi:hypothetical protein CVT24_005878, partial [Panaeolus cyanescens]
MSFLEGLLSIFGYGVPARDVSVMFWGTDNDEMTTLLHLIKTGKYAFKPGSVYPIGETIKIGNINLNLAIPSGNRG